MKKVKIYKSSSGNTIFTDLDETSDRDKPKDEVKTVWVYYQQTTKAEMRKHIDNRDFMVLQAHTDDMAECYVATLSTIVNLAYPGSEYVYFICHTIDGSAKIFEYSVRDDRWSES